jgi:hypothetical protein
LLDKQIEHLTELFYKCSNKDNIARQLPHKLLCP